MEQYIKLFVFRHKRALLEQFRMGVLPLAIEISRFKSICVEERECVLCNMNDIEDKIYMLCIRTLYQHIMIEMYNPEYIQAILHAQPM